MAKKNKNPKQALDIISSKSPKRTQNPEGYEHQLIAWHFCCMDSKGKWPCTIDIIKGILYRLHEYEQKQWNEIGRDDSSHAMQVAKISPAAQRRLKDLNLDDTETVYQLKIANGQSKQRLWGIRTENIFQILWWDPRHEVYPLPKR